MDNIRIFNGLFMSDLLGGGFHSILCVSQYLLLPGIPPLPHGNYYDRTRLPLQYCAPYCLMLPSALLCTLHCNKKC